jgi:hypothetical protein
MTASKSRSRLQSLKHSRRFVRAIDDGVLYHSLPGAGKWRGLGGLSEVGVSRERGADQ